jgi:hypothetical protein
MKKLVEAEVLSLASRALKGVKDRTDGVEKAPDCNRK